MTVGASQATAIGELSAIFQATAFSYSNVYVQYHLGDPGAAGTANPAAETRRANASAAFGTAPSASGGNVTIANDAVFGALTSVAATESWTHVSFWSASTSGTFIGSSTITTVSVTSGGNFTGIPIGDCVISKPVAA